MKNPFKKLSRGVKRGAVVALLTVGLGLAGIHVNPELLSASVDIGFKIADEVTADEQ